VPCKLAKLSEKSRLFETYIGLEHKRAMAGLVCRDIWSIVKFNFVPFFSVKFLDQSQAWTLYQPRCLSYNAHLKKILSFENVRPSNNTLREKFCLLFLLSICHCNSDLAFKSKNYDISLQHYVNFMRENFQDLLQKCKWAFEKCIGNLMWKKISRVKRWELTISIIQKQ
jgi:hypothetical protein